MPSNSKCHPRRPCSSIVAGLSVLVYVNTMYKYLSSIKKLDRSLKNNMTFFKKIRICKVLLNCLRNGKRMVLLAIWHPWEEDCCCWLIDAISSTTWMSDRMVVIGDMFQCWPPSTRFCTNQHMLLPPYDCCGFCASARTYVSLPGLSTYLYTVWWICYITAT